MKSLNKSDLAFVSVVLAGFCAAGWFLAADSVATGGRSKGKVVGSITYKNHLAERKVTGEVLWDSLEQHATVYNDDTVRTTEGSSAVIHLKNQTEISLGERTMVLVSVTDRTKIAVSGGRVAVRTADSGGPAPVTMSTSSGTVSLTSGSLSLTDSASGTSVNVESGTAMVNSGTSTQQVTENSVVALDGSAPVTLSLVPQVPGSGQMVAVSSQRPQVSFQWTQSGTGPQTGRLTVASDSQFQHLEYQGDFAGTGTALVLGEGTHYWKLSSAGAATPARWFSVVAQGPPRVLEPSNDEVFPYSQGLPLVRFSWLPLAFASTYRVEIYAEAMDGKPLVSGVTSFAALALNTLEEGDYQGRVVATSGQDGQEFASPAIHFTIQKNRLAAPSLKGTDQELSAVAVKNGAVLASWDEVEGADHYRAVLTRIPSEAQVLSTQTASNTLRLDRLLSPGSYSMRVSALSGTAASDPSPAVTVRIGEIKPLAPRFPARDAVLEPADRTVAFRWSDPNSGQHYRLTLSSEATFGHPLLSVDSKVEQVSAVVPEALSGVFFWRVQLLDDSGTAVGTSEPTSFFLPRLFKSPRPLFPVNGQALDVNSTEVLRFAWSADPEATSYQVTLYRVSAGLRSSVRSWTTDKPALTTSDFTPLSTEPYAWEVRAQTISGNRLLGQSRPVLSYFRLLQSHPLPAPNRIFAGPEDQP